jgi:YesN/AraC family two-component response regulator
VVNIVAQMLSRQPYGEVLSLDEENSVLFFSFDEAESDCTPKIYAIIREIEQSLHFRDPDLDLQEISEFVGITKNHLSYQFSRETGEHLRDYIHRVRIEEAKKLLLNTNKKVYEVCDLVGYTNVESFSRIFKKLTGVSPNKYNK